MHHICSNIVDTINLITDNVSVFALASEKLKAKVMGDLSDNKDTKNCTLCFDLCLTF